MRLLLSRRGLVLRRARNVAGIIGRHEVGWRRYVSLLDNQLFLGLLDALNLSHNSEPLHVLGEIQVSRRVSRLRRRALDFQLILGRRLYGGLAHLLLWVNHIFDEIGCERWPVRGFGRNLVRCLLGWRLGDYVQYGLIGWRRR